MFKKSLSVLLIISIFLVNVITININASEALIFQDNFESYTSNVTGDWYVQPSGTVPVENTDKGKSAKVVSTSSTRCELVRKFTKTPASTECVVFSFSMLLQDNYAQRTLLSKTEETDELFLLTFKSATNTISINGTSVPADDFTYETNIWYDVRFSYNLNDGLIKVEFDDENGNSTRLYGSGNMGVEGIERVNFASFKTSSGESVWYIDDVSVYTTEAFTKPLGFTVINENFDRNDVGYGIYGFDCKKETNVCDNPFTTIQTDKGKSASVVVDDGYSLLTRNVDYLRKNNNIAFSASLKSNGNACVSFNIDDVTMAKIDYKNNNVFCGLESINKHIEKNKWVKLKGEINKRENTISLVLPSGSGYEDIIYCNYDFAGFNPSSFTIRIDSDEETTVLFDEIILEGFVVEKYIEPSADISNNNIKMTNQLFSTDFNSYTTGVPSGWGFQNYYNASTLSKENDCLKISNQGHGCRLSRGFSDEEVSDIDCLRFEYTLEFEDLNCERYIAFTDDDGNDFYFLEFLKDSGKIRLLGKEISSELFSYSSNTRYKIVGEYNIKTGYGELTVTHDAMSKTFDSTGDVMQSIRSIALGVSASSGNSSTLIQSATFYNVADVVAKERKINRINADDFEYYNNGVPSRFRGTFTGGGRVCSTDSAYGICAALMSNSGGSCTLTKIVDSILGKVFYTGISVCSPDGYSKGSLYVRVTPNNSSTSKNVRLFDFSTDGILIGNTKIPISFDKGKWYNADILCNTSDGTVKGTINGQEFTCSINDLKGEVSSYYIKSSGTQATESAFYIDDVAFCGGGFYGIENDVMLENLSADTRSITLKFTEPVSGCKVIVNGSDHLVNSVIPNGNKVTVNLAELERAKNYSLSFSNATDSYGNIYSGNFRFKTSGSEIKVANSGVKNENGSKYISNGWLTVYSTLYSDTPKDVDIFVCAYDRERYSLLAIKSVTLNVGPDGTKFEGSIDIPENYYDCKIGYYVFEHGSLVPIKKANDVLPYNIPSGDEIISQIFNKTGGQHPRILANKNDFIKMRNTIAKNNTAAGDYFNLMTEADTIMTKPLTSYSMSGVTLLTSGSLLSRIKTLSMAYRITGNTSYAERVYLELENASLNFNDWNSQHFLDTSNIIMAFAIGYDWIYDYIENNASRKAVIVNAIKNIGFKAVLDDYLDRDRTRTNRWLYITTPDNWNIYCNSAALTAAIVFSDDLPEECRQIFDYGFKYIQTAMQNFDSDGGWFEGVGYWNYLMDPLTMLLGSMEKSIGSYYGLTDAEGFKNSANFLIGMTGSSDIVFNFHNCLDEHMYAGSLFYFAKMYNNKNIYTFINGFLRRNRTTMPFQSLLWNDYENDSVYENMPLDFLFRGTEVCSMRSGWGKNDTFVGLHAGYDAHVHGHSDVGEFVLDMLGERFAMALGKDNYELVTPIWHGLYRERAEGHNTLVLNPDGNPDQSKTSNALIDRFESKPDEAFAVTDMTTAYKDNARFAIRGVKLTDNRRVVVVRDEIECLNDSDIWWFMHTDASISLSSDKKTAILTKNNKKIKVAILGNNQQQFEIMDAVPFPTTPLPTNGTQNPNTGIKKLAIHISGANNANITVAASPENYTLKENYQTNINEW